MVANPTLVQPGDDDSRAFRGAHNRARRSCGGRRGAALIAVVVVLVIVDVAVITIVLGGARDHLLTVQRVQTIEAMYAAEAGSNMSIREMMFNTDYDGDGAVGSISDDGNAANDPSLGRAQFYVATSAGTPLPSQTLLTSEGRSGDARRTATTILE